MSNPDDAGVSIGPPPRGTWSSYREHAVVIIGWISIMACRLNNPTALYKVAKAQEDLPTLLLLSRQLAQAGYALPVNVENSIRYCLAPRRRFVEWTALHRGNHQVSTTGTHKLKRTLDAAALEQILADFKSVNPSVTTDPFPRPLHPPSPDCGAINDVPFGLFLLFEDIHNIRGHVESVWRQYRAKQVSLATASLTTHAAIEAIEVLDHAANDAGAPPSHGIKIGALIHYLALGETSFWTAWRPNRAEAERVMRGAHSRFERSGFHVSPELQLWLMRDISNMLLSARDTRDRPVDNKIHQIYQGVGGIHVDQDWHFILRLRQCSSSIANGSRSLERFLDLPTVYLSRAEEHGTSLLHGIAGTRILLDIHQIGRSDMAMTALREAYRVQPLLSQDQANKPGDSPAVRRLKKTSRRFLQWIDHQTGFPGSDVRTVSPVLCGLAVAFLGEMKNTMQNPKPTNSAAPNLRRLRENYVRATWKPDLFMRLPSHAEHRLLSHRNSAPGDNAPAEPRETCVEYLAYFSAVVEAEVRNVVPTAPTAESALVATP